MRRSLRPLAFLLLGFLALAQSGAPAFFGGLWARVAMYQEYESLMSRREAADLILRGDFGCGFFTELEALTETADTFMLAWFEGSQPLLLATPSPIALASPFSTFSLHRQETSTVPDHRDALEPPPPRAL